jgi:carbon monoxide dehydrogenase subunit G
MILAIIDMSLKVSSEGTVLTYHANVKLCELLAAVSKKVITSTAKVGMGLFFREIEKEPQHLITTHL